MKYQIIPVTSFMQNCSLVICTETNKAALVDPGGDMPKLISAIEKAGVTLEKILLTHAHLDHVGATKALANKFSVPIEGPHIDDKFWLDALPQQSQMFGFAPAEPFVPTRWLNHGDTVSVGNLSFNVYHTPGHTPGHVVFVQPEHKKAFVGDVLFAGSIGRTDFPKGDHQTLVSSIQKILFPLGDDIEFIPGHGENSTFGHEKKTNPFVSSMYR
jgi:glyoxylase-like metal-dependent hydrolase (beta-lactamase superfamily II)